MENKGNPVLVTGATGNVGSAVVAALQRAGQPVRAAVRDVAKAQGRFGEGVTCVEFDFKRPVTFEAAFKDVKRLFLMRPPDISNAQRDIAPALEAAKRAGVEHIVFLSLLGVEKTKFVPHYKIEQLVRQSGLTWTFLRASFFMQNLDTTQRQDIREHHDLFVPAGRGRTSFIDVRDIGAVAALALTGDGHANRAYDLSGSEALDYYQVARTFTEVLGHPIRYSKPSAFRFFWRWWRERKQPVAFVTVMSILYISIAFGQGATVTPETARILGRPPTSLRQYVEDYREVWL